MDTEAVRRLEATAQRWDRCAMNAGSATYLNPDPGRNYREYAAACRAQAERLKTPGTRPGVSD